MNKNKLEDLKVLSRSLDLFYNVKIGQSQLQLIMKHILSYHIWGSQPVWSSDLSNMMNNPSVISVKRCLDRYVAVQMWPWIKGHWSAYIKPWSQ